MLSIQQNSYTLPSPNLTKIYENQRLDTRPIREEKLDTQI